LSKILNNMQVTFLIVFFQWLLAPAIVFLRYKQYPLSCRSRWFWKGSFPANSHREVLCDSWQPNPHQFRSWIIWRPGSRLPQMHQNEPQKQPWYFGYVSLWNIWVQTCRLAKIGNLLCCYSWPCTWACTWSKEQLLDLLLHWVVK